MGVHPWEAMPRWKKRLHGFFSYQLAAFFALIWPERVDRAMYRTLAEQYGENLKANP